jgi:isochorismate synthase EntC
MLGEIHQNSKNKFHEWNFYAFLNYGAFLRLDRDRLAIFTNKNSDRGLSSCGFPVDLYGFFGDRHCHWEFDSKTIMSAQTFKYFIKAYLEAEFDSENEASKLLRENFQMPSEEEFRADFSQLHQMICQGDLIKAVPCAVSSGPSLSITMDRARIIFNLLDSPSMAYGAWDSHSGILGATPEILFDRTADSIETMALAGTMSKHLPEAKARLLADPKERREHQLVIESIVATLKRFGKVRVGETGILELPKLYHLMTPISAIIDPKLIDSADNAETLLSQKLLKALHPTPALGIWPKSSDLSILKNLTTGERRDFFGSPIRFVISEPNLSERVLVTIRSIYWNEAGSNVGAGCGILKESSAEAEWREIQTKFNATFEQLGIL